MEEMIPNGANAPLNMTIQPYPYQDPDLPIKERVDDLVSRLTLDEKVSQTLNDAPAIPRLEIPAYNWWNECLHGVGRAGIATVFPQAIGLAATWDVSLMSKVATAISDEARAKHHEAIRKGVHDIYTGLTYWSPNINIFRDPRWGRGQETYGEDPYLTSRMGVTFVRGLQGDDPHYLKLVATPKHFAVHSGPESERHRFNACPSARDFRETYLAAFKACIQEGGAVSIMGAYNRLYSEPCCASPLLLEKIIREEWGFGGEDGLQGYVVSDCGAIDDIYFHQQIAHSLAEAAALGMNAGCDLNCGDTYADLGTAVKKGLVSEATIDQAVRRLFTARFRLGMFDPPERVPYAQIPMEINDSPGHQALALQAARESIVLLKNDGLLPLKEGLGSIAVIGPNADNVNVLLGNYFGTPSQPVTILEGMRRRVGAQTQIRYASGCSVVRETQSGFPEALQVARESDLVILALGLSQLVEGEEGQQEGVDDNSRSLGDRRSIELPGGQEALLQAVHAIGKPVVLVLLNGSALAVPWAAEHLPAIVEAWYPGQAGGTAVAEVLFGDVNPAGRLPVTFYRGTDQLPPFEDYSMRGRTYRYFRGEPLYPFGYGLSYTRFAYRDLKIETTGEEMPGAKVQLVIENSGDRDGDEVVQLYLRSAAAPGAIWQLRGFERVLLRAGESKTITLDLDEARLACFDDAGRECIFPGEFQVMLSGCFPGADAYGSSGVSRYDLPILSGSFKIR
jgi:beta-glucosidase